MENFNELLQKYADFIVRVGVNPQPGQTLIINCPLEGAPLARLCVRSAYEAGARDVQVNWQDDAVTRIRMELGSEDALTDHKGWQLRRYLDYAESEGGVCVLHLIADDPELFAGLDGAKISRVNSANRSFMQPWREYTMNDRVQWSIAALPAEPWAKKMFPELDTAAAIEAQWKLIFDTCRVTGGDPVGEWQKHLDRLNELGAKKMCIRDSHGLPTGGASLQGHVAVGSVFLGDAHRAGVQVKVPLSKVRPCGHMGVAVEQNVPRGKGRQMVQVEHMAVGDVDQPLPHRQHGVICQHREIEHHLVHLGIAVAAHTQQLGRKAVQQRNHLFGGVIPVSYTHLDVYKRQLPRS